MPGATVEEKIITATFLCENSFNDFLNFHKPGWNELITKPLSEKITIVGLTVEDIFPRGVELSEGVGLHAFSSSFLVKPGLFVRIRPGKKNVVTGKLKEAGLSFTMQGDDCFAFPNSTKLDTVLELDKDALVQDLNSQKVLNSLKDPLSVSRDPASGIQHWVSGLGHSLSAWDCCAASGGKSILLYDILKGQVELAVSDIRESILSNLKKRFSIAGIKKYKSFIADLSAENPSIQEKKYSLIICDAPCTGSGTWSRTPEQLYHFKTSMTDAYAEKQRKIISNTIPQLEEGGLFFYITCSVFKKENEDQVNYVKEKFHLQLLQMELLKGFDKKADSMFVAVFMKN